MNARSAQDDTLYRHRDPLLARKEAMIAHLRLRWSDPFGARHEVLLHDPGSRRLAASLVNVIVGQEERLAYQFNKDKVRQVRRCEGRYLLRTNLAEQGPDTLWRC